MLHHRLPLVLALALTTLACTPHGVQNQAPLQAPALAPQLVDNSTVDAGFANGRTLNLNISAIGEEAGKRQVLAFKEQVKTFDVTLTDTSAGINYTAAGVSASGTSATCKANFVNLPPDHVYGVTIVAKDLNGAVISASQSPVAAHLFNLTDSVGKSKLLSYVVQLMDTRVMSPTAQAEVDVIQTIDGELKQNLTPPAPTVAAVSTAAAAGFQSLGSFNNVPTPRINDNADGGFLNLDVSGRAFATGKTYQAFLDNGSPTGVYQGNVEVRFQEAGSDNIRWIELKFTSFADQKLNLYFDNDGYLIGMSNYGATPNGVKYIDPEEVILPGGTPVQFSSASYPSGTSARQFTWLDEGRRVYQLFTNMDDGADRTLLGLMIPGEVFGTTGTMHINLVSPL